jgi:hypothetical protein
MNGIKWRTCRPGGREGGMDLGQTERYSMIMSYNVMEPHQSGEPFMQKGQSYGISMSEKEKEERLPTSVSVYLYIYTASIPHST